jgi:hypothetical protein
MLAKFSTEIYGMTHLGANKATLNVLASKSVLSTTNSEMYYPLVWSVSIGKFTFGPELDLRRNVRDGRPQGLHETEIESTHFIRTFASLKLRKVSLYADLLQKIGTRNIIN